MNREELDFVANILNEIVSTTISFHDANIRINKADYDNEKRKRFISYLGAVLRNYVSLNAVVNSYFSRLPKDLRAVLLIAIAVIRFSKNEQEINETIEVLKLAFRDFELENFFPSLNNLVTFLRSDLKLVPVDTKANSLAYFSCVYNLPEPILRMWAKQFGFPNAIKSASAYNRRGNLFYRVNTAKTTTEQLIAASNGIIKESRYPDIVIYEGKLPFRKSTFHNDGLLFRTSPAINALMHSLELIDKDILLYAADESVLPIELFLAFQETKGKSLDVLAATDEVKYPLLQKANIIRTERQYVRTSNLSALEANLHKKYDVLFYIPKSSKFDDITSRPELLIQTNLDDLNKHVALQFESLVALSDYVTDQGSLVYLVPTLSRKESSRLIADFIVAKPEFSLVSEMQVFPFEKGNSTLYYAILRKDVAKDES